MKNAEQQIRKAALEEAAIIMEHEANSAAAEGDERGVRLFEGAAESIRALKETCRDWPMLFHIRDGGIMIPTGKMVTYCGLGGEYTETKCSVCGMLWCAPDSAGDPECVGTISGIMQMLQLQITGLYEDISEQKHQINALKEIIASRNKDLQSAWGEIYCLKHRGAAAE